ncbi:cysteine--tRNA ligase [Francisella halioticida]|uniref:Cysteine--tRNA ligase n=1 Tax=Francisella halioticida TaxID=549298 RepID=A0ABN5B2E8_9GAMM|nr:cysteine--tRNA ligase [Francisella halioticida]ASG68733.1 cysteine--tRNA ligase [Francisella halioticida]BCD91683.1 cysteine--tRNA ligase [Francisella halioticida]
MIFYNSLSGKKEEFKPIEVSKIKMYACGVTVYDDCHIGHARTYIAFDVINRYFKYRGFDVTLVRNITDIDDKIIKRSNENKESTAELVDRNIKAMHDVFARLNILEPTREPRATETIPEMIAMIETLVDKEYAYQGSNGDVFYRVAKFADYGKLSKQNLEALQQSSRVDVVDEKEYPMDFVLWKMAKNGEPAWDSPWGAGRPGWHIECSAMSKKLLGETFDIHAGGSDLRFPHHENEIAQSEACNGCTFANYWLHSGMVKINAEKMSKSLNNFFTIVDVLEEYHPEVVRYFLASTVYRSEINYSKENLDNARASIERLFNALRDVEPIEVNLPDDASQYEEKFIKVMDNDFNTPEALAVLFSLAKKINILKATNKYKASGYAYLLRKLCNVLGILFTDIEEYFKQDDDVDDSEIEKLIAERTQAKKDKNYARADEIRNQLQEQGIILEDSVSGTTWKKG